MSDKLRWRTFLVALVFFISSMSGMLVYASEKAIVITEVSQEQLLKQNELAKKPDKPKLQEARSFVFDVESKAGDRLCIPLQSGVKAENVIIENRYTDEELRITLVGGDAAFYNTQAVYGDITGIKSGTYEENALGVLMVFKLTDIFECKSVLEGGKLYIDFVSPGELYDKIVVIDPVYGVFAYNDEALPAGEEAAIVLDVAKRLKTKLDASDIKAYFTRLENIDLPENVGNAGLELVEKVQADFILSIGVAGDVSDGKKYGTEVIYNKDFFTPEFNSTQLADVTLRQVVNHISGRGNGIFAATETETTIWNAPVPAAFLKMGYLSNEQEAKLLAREDYREKIAEGIYRAIRKVYEGEE